ncbi:MAG: radical SAM protein [Proteobacteria bacterium]|nr:radical SAM protein [Pseudomonadota bacterium]
MFDPRNTSPTEFIKNSELLGVNVVNARALLGAIIGKGDLDPSSWQQQELISKKLATGFSILPSLKLIEVLTSSIDGFQKLIFETEDNLKIETVIIPLHIENRVSICLSSQVGCVMACDFCATARMTKRRNLKAWEIVDQVRQAREIVLSQGRNITGAVFMGMGEPFLNYDNVMIAAEHFCFPIINAISAKAITISTVGLIKEIDRFTSEQRPFRLSISLGSAFDHKRKKLVPVAARTPVSQVITAAKRHAEARKDRINLAYVCISGENIFEEDAKELAKIIDNTKVRLDLIDVNDTSGNYKKPSEEEIKQFRDWLNFYLKQPVARRYSGGSDIRAACGTLEAI